MEWGQGTNKEWKMELHPVKCVPLWNTTSWRGTGVNPEGGWESRMSGGSGCGRCGWWKIWGSFFPPSHQLGWCGSFSGFGGLSLSRKRRNWVKRSAVWAGPGLPDVSCRSSYEEQCRRRSLILLHPFPHCFMLVAGTLFMALKAHTWLSVDIISWPGAVSNSPKEPCLLVPCGALRAPWPSWREDGGWSVLTKGKGILWEPVQPDCGCEPLLEWFRVYLYWSPLESYRLGPLTLLFWIKHSHIPQTM